MTGRNGERGAVLVAVLLVLALLSLLGSGAMLSSSLDTQAVGNQKESRMAAYAAEAALDFAANEILAVTRDPADQTSALPYAVYVPDGLEHPIGGVPGLTGPIIPGIFDPTVAEYNLSYIVELPPGQVNAEESWPTTDNAQSMLNYALGYVVTGIAVNPVTGAEERVKETLRILRRPLTQYLSFYVDDMNWRPRVPIRVNGGRIHATGDIYLAPQAGMTFDYGPTVFAMTAGGSIRRYEEMQEGGSGPAGTGAGDITFPLGTLTDHIYAENQAVMEDKFMITPPGGTRPLDGMLRTGVDYMRPLNATALAPNGYYSQLASGAEIPQPGTDCFFIGANGRIQLLYWTYPFDITNPPTPLDVTQYVHDYETPAGPVRFKDAAADPGSIWSNEALGNADGSQSSDTDRPIKGSIVYSYEDPPDTDEANNPPVGNFNKDYPGELEMSDPRENNMAVHFTVVDLQRLENWYRDFIVENGYAGPADFPLRKLLIYATRVTSAPSTPPLEAIKLIGSLPGRWRNTTVNTKDPFGAPIRQLNDTALVPTTFVTNLPLYIEGDFSTTPLGAPGGKPIVILADSITALSNQWGVQHYDRANPGAITPAWETAYNAAFFAGRHQYSTPSGSGSAEGVENLLRLLEDWSAVNFYVTGSLNSLWYSFWAREEFNEALFVSPADTLISWNVQFGDLTPQLSPQGAPPYVPSVYLLERESWQEK